jgi:hypothetical protein
VVVVVLLLLDQACLVAVVVVVVVQVSSKSLSPLQHIRKESIQYLQLYPRKIKSHSFGRAVFCYDIWRRSTTLDVGKQNALYIRHTSILYNKLINKTMMLEWKVKFTTISFSEKSTKVIFCVKSILSTEVMNLCVETVVVMTPCTSAEVNSMLRNSDKFAFL